MMNSVSELTNYVKNYISNYTDKQISKDISIDILTNIRKQVNPLGINVHFELNEILDDKIQNETQNKSQNKTQNKRVEDTGDQKGAEPLLLKFIFSTVRSKADFRNLLVQKSNGLIIAVNANFDIVVLCDPSYDFKTINKLTDLDGIDLTQYEVYSMKDGTTINLYFNREWCLGTKKAINAGPLEWRGFTLQEVFDDCTREYPEFNLDSLDKTKTYSIGMKHPARNPYLQPDEWKREYFENCPELPWMKELWMVSGEIEGIPKQIPLSFSLEQMKELIKNNGLDKKHTDSLGYIFRVKTREIPIEPSKEMEDLSKEKINETPKEKKEDVSETELFDFSIETPLWKSIRNMIYQLPFIENKYQRANREKRFRNMHRVILDSYLDIARHGKFIEIFPQFKKYYVMFDHLFDYISDKLTIGKVYKREGKRNLHSALALELGITEDIMNDLVNTMRQYIDPQYKISVPKGKENLTKARKFSTMVIDKKVIKDLLLRERYSNIYFETFFKIGSAPSSNCVKHSLGP